MCTIILIYLYIVIGYKMTGKFVDITIRPNGNPVLYEFSEVQIPIL
jgi:hypothetical protein